MFKKYSLLLIQIVFCLVLNQTAFAYDKFPTGETIKRGMTGSAVASLQRYLNDKGFISSDKITGYFGPITERAVRYFQQYSGIEATGIVGPKTNKKIYDSLLVKAVTILPSVKPVLATTTDVAISSSTPIVTVDVASTTAYIYRIEAKPVYDFRRLSILIQNVVNQKRVQFDLDGLSWNEELVGVTIDHSQDQAKDNFDLTQPNLTCHYPIIRHEGFTYLGYSLKDRLYSRNIKYRYAGENIAMIPASKNLLYLNPMGKEVQTCDKVLKFEPGDGTEEDRISLFRQIFNSSKDAVKNLSPVAWINKEWRTEQEIAEITVDGWMNSPGHRANILKKEYSTAAIGIVAVNDYLIITHNFLGY